MFNQLKSDKAHLFKYDSIYKGVVIDNADLNTPYSGKVQVYIPDVHSVNLINFLKNKEAVSYKFPGDNLIGDMTDDVVNYLRNICPWAIPCMPIIGETGPGIYNNQQGSVSDDTCIDLTGNNTREKPASVYNDAFNAESNTDNFSNPKNIMSARGNPYGNSYQSPPYPNHSKGVFAIPRVGAQLLIMFFKDDPNYPVYLGSLPSESEFQQIYSMDGTYPGYPKGYEQQIQVPANTPEKNLKPDLQQPNINTNASELNLSNGGLNTNDVNDTVSKILKNIRQ